MGHEDGFDGTRVRSASGLALRDGHGPSAVIECLNAIRVNDGGAIAALVPPDVPVHDHRVDSDHRFHDGRSLVATLARWGTELPFDLTLLAHRGTDHALVRLDLALEAGTLACLIGATCDHGSVRRLAVYDLDDLASATRDISLAWAEECSPVEAQMIEVSTQWLCAILERDFASWAELTGDDFVIDDHRPGTVCCHDPAASIELLSAVLSDDDEVSDLLTEVVGINANASLSWRTQITPGRLGEVDEELALAAVSEGKVVRLELYEAHQLDRALRRLDDFAGRPTAAAADAWADRSSLRCRVVEPLGHVAATEPVGGAGWIDPALFVEGLIAGPIRDFVDAAKVGDGVAMDALTDPAIRVDDRRTRTDTPLESRAQVLAALEAFGPNAFDVRLVALREQRLAVVRLMFERTEGGIADITVLLDSDANRLTRMDVHDTAAFVGVVKALSDAHLDMLEPDRRRVLGVSASTLRAIVDRRFDDVAMHLSDDFVYRDHRESMPIELDRAGSVALLTTVVEDSPGTFDYAPEVITVTSSALLSTRTSTTLDRLGGTEIDLTAMRVRDGRLSRFEIFERSHLDRARRLVSTWY